MSTIDLDRQILQNFLAMKEGVLYQMLDRDWATYQDSRVRTGYGRTDESNQRAWTFERRGQQLHYLGQQIFDFATWAENPALALSFALTLTAFAFATFALGAFALALKPLGSPDPPATSPAPITDLDGLMCMLPGLEGQNVGFWAQVRPARVAGAQTTEAFELHFRGLTEEKAARLLAAFAQMADH